MASDSRGIKTLPETNQPHLVNEILIRLRPNTRVEAVEDQQGMVVREIVEEVEMAAAAAAVAFQPGFAAISDLVATVSEHAVDISLGDIIMGVR